MQLLHNRLLGISTAGITELFSKAFHISPAALAIVRISDNRYVAVNQSFLKLFEFSYDKIINRSTKELSLFPIDYGKKENAIENDVSFMIRHGDAQTREITAYTRNGKKLRVLYSLDMVLINGEKHILATVIDVTKNREIEDELKQSEKYHDQLFGSMNLMFQVVELIHDENGKTIDYYYRDVNPTFEVLTGKTREQLINKRAKEFGIIEDYWLEAYDEVAKSGKPKVVENYAAEFDKYYEVHIWKTKENHVAIIFSDITQRKKIELRLKESEEQFQRAIEDAPIPIIMQAENGEVLQISKTWTELTGYTLNEVSKFDEWLTKAVYGEGASKVRDHMRELFKGNKRSINVEFAIHTLKGEVRYWSFSASLPGTLLDGRRFIVGMAVDTTERKGC